MFMVIIFVVIITVIFLGTVNRAASNVIHHLKFPADFPCSSVLDCNRMLPALRHASPYYHTWL